MATKNCRYFVGDFETTVFTGQEFTEVWASAIVELYTENVEIFHSIADTWDYLKNLKQNIVIYYHNLKFDGAFWIDYFIRKLHYKQAYIQTNDNTIAWKKDKDMISREFKYIISDRGQWYQITVKIGRNFIIFRDSLKLIPMSVAIIGASFGTKRRKTEIEYTGKRYAGCEITSKEREYIANDVLVVKEAIEIMFNDGHNRLTIGSCCLEELKISIGKREFKEYFPNMYNFDIDFNKYGFCNADEFCRKAYFGGWCYVKRGYENRIIENGLTADVNGLYTSVMHSVSGNYYPVGYPHFWLGGIPEIAEGQNKYYYVRFRCSFKLRENFLPFIQIKDNLNYNSHEMLETSDILNRKTGKYKKYLMNEEGELERITVAMTLTCTDWKRFNEHYNVENLEIISGCWFFAEIGIFDKYIDKYSEIKAKNKGAIRTEAKLFLNNSYGKLATSDDSSFKYFYMKPDETLGMLPNLEHNKIPGYIPAGAAITSYARDFTIRHAQKNYQSFRYSDTDSIHCACEVQDLVDIEVHDTKMLCWKIETNWEKAIFVRQKAYIEFVTHENQKPIAHPYYNIKCAGLPNNCKRLLELSLHSFNRKLNSEKSIKKNPPIIKKAKIGILDSECLEFLKIDRKLTDFKCGLTIPKKLRPKRIIGGIVLEECLYTMHEQ